MVWWMKVFFLMYECLIVLIIDSFLSSVKSEPTKDFKFRFLVQFLFWAFQFDYFSISVQPLYFLSLTCHLLCILFFCSIWAFMIIHNYF